MRNDINFIMTFIRKPQAFILGKFRLENLFANRCNNFFHIFYSLFCPL
jgi:hypothetical protein